KFVHAHMVPIMPLIPIIRVLPQLPIIDKVTCWENHAMHGTAETSETMMGEWVEFVMRMARRPAQLYRSNSKIVRNQRATFACWDDALQLDDVGYTVKKLKDLTRLYLHDESRDAAVRMWEAGGYSVGFHTFAHLSKPASLRSEQGPCMLSVAITR